MGFFSNIISGVVKVAITPIAVVTDIVNVVKGEEPDATKELLQSAGEDFTDAMDDACGG